MKFAVIGTFHGRHENSFPLMHRLFVDGTRKPDEAWLLCEDDEDYAAIYIAFDELGELGLCGWPDDSVHIEIVPTPRTPDGSYQVIPYSNKINFALNRCEAGAIVYLDNGSMPGPDKYRVLAEALETHPEWGAVYCTQKRSGYIDELFVADEILDAPEGRLNYTQVMHRPTADRWPTEMLYAKPDTADGLFWSRLAKSLGSFHPAGGSTVHDDHHMPSPHAQGL